MKPYGFVFGHSSITCSGSGGGPMTQQHSLGGAGRTIQLWDAVYRPKAAYKLETMLGCRPQMSLTTTVSCLWPLAQRQAVAASIPSKSTMLCSATV